MSMHLSLSKLLSRKYAVVVHLIQHNVLMKCTAKWHVLRLWSCCGGRLIKPALKQNDKQTDTVFMALFVVLCGSIEDNGIIIKTHWAPWLHGYLIAVPARGIVFVMSLNIHQTLHWGDSHRHERMWISDGWILSLESSGSPCTIARPVTL